MAKKIICKKPLGFDFSIIPPDKKSKSHLKD